MLRRISIKILLALITIVAGTQIARTFDLVGRGLPPFGSFSGGPFDIVNNANLNVHMTLPIVAKQGRGLPFDFKEGFESWALWNYGGAWHSLANWGETRTSKALLG